MRGMLVRSIVVILLFALIGLIWGRLRPVRANIVYLDLVSSYRNNILDQVEREQKTLAPPSYENNNGEKNGNEAVSLAPSDSVHLPRDSVLSPISSPPKEQQKGTQKSKEGIFGSFFHWIKNLFTDSNREKEREQIREEVSLSKPQPVPNQEPLTKKQEIPPLSPKMISPKGENAKGKNPPRSSISNKEQQDLLKDADISKFLLNTDVIPKEKK